MGVRDDKKRLGFFFSFYFLGEVILCYKRKPVKDTKYARER